MNKVFFWGRYSKKLARKIENPKNVGFFSKEDADARELRLVIGKEQGVNLFWLVDEKDGVIVDSRFQVYGPSALIGAAEIACDLLVMKNYDQARRISADLIDKQVRDKTDVPAFPDEVASCLNHVLFAIEQAADQCSDIPLAVEYVAPPMSGLEGQEQTEYPGWRELTVPQKITVIEQVIASDIRPYIELDAGNVKVINYLGDNEIIIAYSGACTTCHSSTGATLSAIQQILRTKVHPALIVTPDLSFATAHQESPHL